jgi:3-methylfumaryl-CoA hydratase
MTATSGIDLDGLGSWIGNTSTVSDTVTPRLVRALRAALFVDPGSVRSDDIAPATTHWCLAPMLPAMNEIGPDGHPERGEFLPPVPLPRRMWAGGTLEYRDALRVGDEVERKSCITDIKVKQGKTGTLCFVTVDNIFSTRRGEAVHEQQQMVYREAASVSENNRALVREQAAAPAAHRRMLVADPVLLFRYSAVTGNDHRIHYDWPYVTGVEGYPGLIVHGPLQASLLVEYAADLHGGRPPRTILFRALGPLFEGLFSLNGRENGSGLDLWTEDSEGHSTMTARASW